MHHLKSINRAKGNQVKLEESEINSESGSRKVTLLKCIKCVDCVKNVSYFTEAYYFV